MQGVPEILGFKGGVEDITRIQFYIAAHGRKHFPDKVETAQNIRKTGHK